MRVLLNDKTVHGGGSIADAQRQQVVFVPDAFGVYDDFASGDLGGKTAPQAFHIVRSRFNSDSNRSTLFKRHACERADIRATIEHYIAGVNGTFKSGVFGLLFG